MFSRVVVILYLPNSNASRFRKAFVFEVTIIMILIVIETLTPGLLIVYFLFMFQTYPSGIQIHFVESIECVIHLTKILKLFIVY